MMRFKFIDFDNTEPEGLYVPAKVEKWYNRQQRSWVVQLKDKYENQIGEASYVATKPEAIEEEKRLKKEHGLND
jgi:hypothetical protein